MEKKMGIKNKNWKWCTIRIIIIVVELHLIKQRYKSKSSPGVLDIVTIIFSSFHYFTLHHRTNGNSSELVEKEKCW